MSVSLEKSIAKKIINQFGSPIQFEMRFNPDFQEKLSGISAGYVECSKFDYPTLSGVCWVYGREVAAHWLAIQIDDLNEEVKVKTKMTDDEKDKTARKIINKHWELKISEIALFFSKMKDEEFGEYYGYIDGGRIMQGLRKYEAEKLATLERYERENKRDELNRKWTEGEAVRVSREEYERMKPILRKKERAEINDKRKEGMRMKLIKCPSRKAMELARYLYKISK